MSKKVALLIGVSEYGEGILSLSAPLNDVAAMERVLKNPQMGGFDEVKTRINPDLAAMQKAVQQIFTNCHKDDLVLLFFSGHGITDDNNRLYLATKGTSKDYYKATSVSANFIQEISLECYAKRQVIVLDCCYSGAFAEGWQTKSVGIDLAKELGAEGRVVLTSSTATQTSFQQEDEKLSLYTQYLVEGIETGAADKEGNGKIYAHELHDYAKAKVQEVKPKQKPEIIIDKEGFNILLSQAPVDDPELDYRKFVEKYATEGQITIAGNYILRVKRQELGITDEKSDQIVNEVLAPYRKRIENIKLYKQAFTEAVEQNYPLSERLLNELQDFEDVLGLEDKDIAQIQRQILAEKEAEYQSQQEVEQQEQKEYENKLQQYKQEFLEVIEQEYPLSENARNQINILQQSLGLRDEDIKHIEQPILAQAEAKYQEKLKEEEEVERQRQQEAEKARELELQKQRKAEKQEEKLKQQEAEHQRRLQQYEQKVSNSIRQGISPFDMRLRQELRRLQQTLRLTDSDASSIETRLFSQKVPQPSDQSNLDLPPIKRQQFLKWIGLVGIGLVAAIGISQMFKDVKVDEYSITDPYSIRSLEEELKSGYWERADHTTLYIMEKAANLKRGDWLNFESLQNIPCETLGEIDQLWLDASGGKFGFSLQTRIYVEECGGTPNGQYDQAAWHCFIDKVGWRVVKENEWVDSTYLTYDTTAPTGHLPFLFLGGLRERWICSLVYRLENCKM